MRFDEYRAWTDLYQNSEAIEERRIKLLRELMDRAMEATANCLPDVPKLPNGRYIPVCNCKYEPVRVFDADQTDYLACCPICGSRMMIDETRQNQGMDGTLRNWRVYCTSCGIEREFPADDFYGRSYYTRNGVIMAWNKLVADGLRKRTHVDRGIFQNDELGIDY